MKNVAWLAAFAATAAAQGTPQFVLYATGDDSSSQRADPIISPGKLSGHVHDFAGGKKFAPELSYEALQNPDCTSAGAADPNRGGFKKDNSVYWHPSLYAKKKDGSGYMKIPTTTHKMYYRKPYGPTKFAEPYEFPEGFRMVGGDPFLRSANKNVTGITHWQCMGPGNVGEDGGFPTLDQPCDQYSGLVAKVHFPHCWNGEDFNQDDPSAHVSYPEGDAQYGDCPSSHPTALPHIEFENMFAMHSEIWDQIDPSTLALAQGDSTGFGMHGDFFNGWVKGAIPKLFDTCPTPQWANQDIGDCPGYDDDSYSSPRTECKLDNYFKEDVEKPGKNLIGCNPISLLNPAPRLAVAKLGMSTDSCGAAGSSDDSYEAPSIDDLLPWGDDSSSPEATATTPAAAPTQSHGSPSYSVPSFEPADVEEEDEEDVVYVTEWVTATAEATAYAKRSPHAHNHMRAHRRRHF